MLNAIIIRSNLKGNYTRKSNIKIYKRKYKHQWYCINLSAGNFPKYATT